MLSGCNFQSTACLLMARFSIRYDLIRGSRSRFCFRAETTFLFFSNDRGLVVLDVVVTVVDIDDDEADEDDDGGVEEETLIMLENVKCS